MHASDFLKSKTPPELPPCVVLYGDQRYLKLQVLDRIAKSALGEDDEFGPSRFEDPAGDLKFADVVSELKTVSMWGDKRLVIVDNADKFVSNHRAALEKYVDQPSDSGQLVLIVDTWDKRTRLYKTFEKTGLPVECNRLTGAALKRWVQQTLTEADHKTIEPDALDLLVELSGHDMGLIERDLAKLIDFLGDRKDVTHEDVVKLVGGWKADTTFRMLQFLRTGQVGNALRELEYLLRAGEDPHRILGGMQFVYRRITTAADAMRLGENARSAVAAAGVFPKERDETARYLDALGARRRSRLSNYFLDAHLAMRGINSLDAKNRIVIERLLIQLAPSST